MNSDRVIDAVTTVWNRRFEDCVSPAMVKSRTRLINVATCRQICIYILRKNTKRTTTSIGKIFGRDHSTVVYTWGVIQGRVDRREIEATIIHEALQLLNHNDEEAQDDAGDEDINILEMYHKERRRSDALEVELLVLRGKNKHMKNTIARQRMELAKLQDKLYRLQDDADYVKPMNWTADEKRRLKEVRGMGLTEVR